MPLHKSTSRTKSMPKSKGYKTSHIKVSKPKRTVLVTRKKVIVTRKPKKKVTVTRKKG